MRIAFALLMGMSVLAGCAQNQPPSPPREFRAAWVATVSNIDWPSKPGLSTAQQQAEMRAILDKAVDLRLNVIILQVRTSCDAFYPSKLEPWSEYLTGVQGKAPEPYYDPLAMWVDEAHKRGLELHAWFNPFRARANTAKGGEADTHISKTRPDLVKKYGAFLWLDPGEPDARDYSLRVFMDVVNRYDIDGVHIDDYFYPYPIKEAGDFPDEPSWKKYQAAGGKLSRADWRRENINELIKLLYAHIKAVKPHVQFGISPFGIWQPGYPPVVKGFNQYESLYADAKLWLNRGWCDYFTPQLYWKISAPNQPYKDLLAWWVSENTQKRHIIPGNIPSRITNTPASWEAAEIVDQIRATRTQPGARGNVHFSMKPLLENRKGLSDQLAGGVYAQQALPPAAEWLSSRKPKAPDVTASASGGAVTISMAPRGKSPVWLWTIYVKRGQSWEPVRIIAGWMREFSIYGNAMDGPPSAIAVGAVDRFNNESQRTIRKIEAEETQSRALR